MRNEPRLTLTQIVAHSADYAIGKDNQLLWHYPEDLKFFKTMTENKILIMGRKTFESILNKLKQPLPNRYHIVISKSQHESLYDNVFYVQSLLEAYEKAESLIKNEEWPNEVMAIGGASIYQQTMNNCQKLYITIINKNYPEADTFYPNNYAEYFKLVMSRPSQDFPELEFQEWQKI